GHQETQPSPGLAVGASFLLPELEVQAIFRRRRHQYGPLHPTRRVAPPEILAQIDDDVGHAASRRQKFLGKSMMMSPLLPVPRICSTASSLPPSSAIFSSRSATNAATQSAMPPMSSSLVNGAASHSATAGPAP